MESMGEGDTGFLQNIATEQSGNIEGPKMLSKLKEEIYDNTGLRRSETEQNTSLVFFPIGGPIDMTQCMRKQDDTKQTLDEKWTGRQKERQLVREGVNRVMSNLAHTLGDIGLESLYQYEQDPSKNLDYLTVAQTVNHIALALKAVGEGKVGFVRDEVGGEEWIGNRGSDGKHNPDKMYFYRAKDVVLDGKKYERIKFFIRPKMSIRKIHTISGASLEETCQDRTTITIESPDIPQGVASIRIDPPSFNSQGRLTYDVVVGGDANNIMHALDLGKVGQQAGHHFTGEHKVSDFNLEPWQVHEGIAARLDSLVENRNS